MTSQIHRFGIEVTLRCNARCTQCDHHCDLPHRLPYVADSDMSLKQIDRFIREVVDNDVRIVRLSVTGGEALVHPQIEEIVERLHRGLARTGRLVRRKIRLVTNGLLTPPPAVQRFCVVKTLTPLHMRRQTHMAVWQAPLDTGQTIGRLCRTRQGCNIPYRCGPVLCRYGYYPCGPGGAIIRLFNIPGWVRYRLPVQPWEEWDLERLRKEVCVYCQYIGLRPSHLLAKDYPWPSRSYAAAFASPPKALPLYGEDDAGVS